MSQNSELKNKFWSYVRQQQPRFGLDDNNRSAFKFLYKYFIDESADLDEFYQNSFNKTKGLMLLGPIGTGKSTMVRLFRDFIGYYYNKSFAIEPMLSVAAHLRMEGNLEKYIGNVRSNSFLPHFNKPKVFCFDDVGVESDISNYYGNGLYPFPELILQRYDLFQLYEIKTHLITNLTLEAFKEKYDDRVYDRMREMFNLVTVLGPSRRSS